MKTKYYVGIPKIDYTDYRILMLCDTEIKLCYSLLQLNKTIGLAYKNFLDHLNKLEQSKLIRRMKVAKSNRKFIQTTLEGQKMLLVLNNFYEKNEMVKWKRKLK